jgi:subtilisin family serine protease
MKSTYSIKCVLNLALILPLLLTLSCREDEPTNNPKSTLDDCLTTQSSTHGDIIPGEYIVSFTNSSHESGRSAPTAARVFTNHRITADEIIAEIDGENLNYLVRLSPEDAEQLKHDSLVERIEPDRVISLCACFTVLEPRTVTWNIDKVGYGDGTGKTAWVLDTGIDFNHPDLTVDSDLSRSFVEGVTSAADDNGHGTHIAGVIGAKNNSIGTLGVASGATLISLKILDSKGDGRLSSAIKALAFVRSNGKSDDVINISMELDEVSEVLETEIRGVANRGIYVAIAAGNDNQSTGNISPARTFGKNIYTVSAVDSLDRFARFSNFGSEIDFAAPGVRILSSYLGGKYAYMSGTSMATPHVAGLLLINNGKINSSGFAINDPDGTPDPLAHQ